MCFILDPKLSPSLWTVCNASLETCLESYGFCLGFNTMEGWEEKHQLITKYSGNTTLQSPCSVTFHHQYFQLIYLS